MGPRSASNARKTIPVVEIDITSIESNPAQPKSRIKFSALELANLADSIKKVGLNNPVIVVKNGDNHTLIAGHRRVAAAKKLGWTTIEARVHDEWPQGDALLALIADNTQREDFTAVEESQAIQSALTLGVDSTVVSKAVGRTADEIALTEKVAKAPKAVLADVTQANFEEAAALIEFADDERAYGDLVRAVGTGRFPHVLQRSRDERKRTQKRAKSLEKLNKDHVAIVDQYDWDNLKLKTHDIDPVEHASCPGHAAYVDHSGDIVYVCTQKKLHGFGASGRGPKSDEEKAADRAKRANRAAHKSATPVRRTFITGMLKTERTQLSKIGAWALTYAWEHGLDSVNGYSTSSLTAELVDGTPVSPLNGVIALACTSMEKRIADSLKFNGLTAGIAEAVDYLDALKSVGYELSEAEESFYALSAGETR